VILTTHRQLVPRVTSKHVHGVLQESFALL
jgi:hypothetical protein